MQQGAQLEEAQALSFLDQGLAILFTGTPGKGPLLFRVVWNGAGLPWSCPVVRSRFPVCCVAVPQ